MRIEQRLPGGEGTAPDDSASTAWVLIDAAIDACVNGAPHLSNGRSGQAPLRRFPLMGVRCAVVRPAVVSKRPAQLRIVGAASDNAW